MTRRRDRIRDAPLLAWGDALRVDKLRRGRLRMRGTIIGAGIAIVLGSAAISPAPLLVWNASASAPVGLYVISRDVANPGDTVVARIPASFRRLADERRYLPMNVPMVKRVTATAGNEVCALGTEIFIDGRLTARRRLVDGAGRPMPRWSGCVRLRGGQLFLLTSHPSSFDGRYFGVTEANDLVGKARLIWRR